jgi:hypothetical protein
MRKNSMRCACLTAVIIASGAFAFPDSSESLGPAKNITLYGSWEQGKTYAALDTNCQWLSRFALGLEFSAALSPRASLIGEVEVKTWYYFPEVGGSANVGVLPVTSISILKAYSHFALGDPQRPKIELDLGFFPFKYNAEVRNLGEYLFRSGTYPPFLITEFDTPYARLMGVSARAGLGPSAHILLVTSETQYYPLYDISLSYIGAVRAGKLLEIGAGVQFARLLPVDPVKTTPEQKLNRMYDETHDNNWKLDTATGIYNVEPTPDSIPPAGYYTFKGTKAAATVMFDIKELLPFEFKNPHDLKLYGEIALLGVKDYPLWYNDLLKRIPVMVGFNAPTVAPAPWLFLAALEAAALKEGWFFRDKIGYPSTLRGAGIVYPALGLTSWALERFLGWNMRFDLVAIELEWYGSRLPPSRYMVEYWNVPKPLPKSDPWDPSKYAVDDFKWSVFAERSVGKHFSLLAQAASDHWEPPNFQNINYRSEICKGPSQYYYLVKLRARI